MSTKNTMLRIARLMRYGFSLIDLRGVSGSLVLVLCGTLTSLGQGAASPQNKNSNNKADQTLKSLARVNPSTLAMELSIPLMSYPGRGRNSLPFGFNYSSKVWRMDDMYTYWTRLPYSCTRQFTTALTPKYAERSIAGWTSTISPPVIEERAELYDVNGKPIGSEFSEVQLSSLFRSLSQVNGPLLEQVISSPNLPCGQFCGHTQWHCTVPPDGNWFCVERCSRWDYNQWCDMNECMPGQACYPEQPPSGCSPNSYSRPAYYIKRVNVRMSDGSVHEFRKSDTMFPYCYGNGNSNNGPGCEGVGADNLGRFLSVDGSGMKLERATSGSTLYLPGGGRYHFPAASQHMGDELRLFFASDYEDINGNLTTYTEEIVDNNKVFFTQKDTLEREIADPLPQNFGLVTGFPDSQDLRLPGLGATQDYTLEWKLLKPHGCEASTNASCGDGPDPDSIGDGALKNQAEKLYYDADKVCSGNSYAPINDPENGYLFGATGTGLVSCSTFYFEGSTATANRFNPTVLAGIVLPDGRKYVFQYNQWGEVIKVTYPTGSYEEFDYGHINPVSSYTDFAYRQTNRGVINHRIYNSDTILQQSWNYVVDVSGSQYKITTNGSRSDSVSTLVKRSERYLNKGTSNGEQFGFDNPLTGMATDERVFDDNGNMRIRTLMDWTYTGPLAGGQSQAKRDARPRGTITISIEGSESLATMSENVYQDPAADSSVPTDPSYFATLNVKEKRSHHYQSIPLSIAQNGSFETIAAYFNGAPLASVSQTDYSYDPAYYERGIIGLPLETRVLNPANPSEVIAKSQVVYDQTPAPNDQSTYPIINAGASPTWHDPNSDLRGNVTTSRTWKKETNTWLEIHAQFDNFGNLRKTWDASGDEDRFIETEFSPDYKYAYPTKVISPAPDPNNTHGTSDTSSVETTYDPTTGLILSVEDDFGQVTRTEYNDPLLRPTRIFGENFAAPIAETIYDDNARTVKVRKQLDESNWDEATTYTDSFGRVIKTVAKDSDGDVTVETHYDLMGRVDRVTNPYRAGDTVYWNKTRYDELGRAVETYAPATLADLANAQSLGVTSFDISTGPNYVGTTVTTTDASGRKGRSITNALGQLVRADEPTTTDGPNDLGDIGSPNQPTYYKYDPYGNMVQVTQGVQNRYFKYNSLGRLIRVNQPEQEYHEGLDLPDAYNTSGHWTAAFDYDDLGNLVTAIDARGVTTVNSYDRAGRVTTRAYYGEPDPGPKTPAVYFFYDGKGLDLQQSPNYARGKLTKVSSSVSEIRYKLFDNFGRLKEMEQRTPAGTEPPWEATPRVSKYTYNLSGALVEEEYPSGRKVKNEYESDGDIKRIYGKATSIAAEQTYANSFSYTPDGKIEKLKLGNGLWESARFNDRLQVTQLALGHSVDEGGLWKLNYEYGELAADGTVDTAKNTGNIAKQIINFGGLSHPFVQTYRYDSLQRLTDAKETKNGSQTWKQTFGHDRYGNRNAFTQIVGSQSLAINNLTFPAVNINTNRFQTNPSQGYVYDRNGNISFDPASGGRQFVFNGDNKQIEVKDANGNPIGKYYYDGEGRRVKKVTDFETTIFVYSAGKLAAEYSTATPPVNPTTNYTATDQLGSPRVLTDKYGTVVSRRDFMPFGEELYADGSHRTTAGKYSLSGEDAVRKRFTGYEKDKETGLDFAEARYYNNQHARFTAVDPLITSGKSANPQTFNRYVYVMNNPLIFTDPTGLQTGTAPDLEKDCKDNCIGSYNAETKTATGNPGSPLVNIVIEIVAGAEQLIGAVVGTHTTFDDVAQQSETNYANKTGGSFYDNNPIFVRRAFLSFAEGNRQLNEGVKTIDPFGIAEFTEMGVKRDFGLASNTDFATSGGFFLFNTTTVLGGGIVQKPVTIFEQYSLRAARDGLYPIMKRGFKEPIGQVFLKQGDVWKYGQTMRGPARYPGDFLTNTGAGLKFVPEFSTTSFRAVFQMEKLKIVEYKRIFGILPPGNKITR